jgi:hypothetical protein
MAGVAAAQKIIAAGHKAGGHPAFWSRIGTIAYDAGYFSEKNCTAEGPDRLIAAGPWTSAGSEGPHTPACQHLLLAQAEVTLAAAVSNLMLLHRRLPGLP